MSCILTIDCSLPVAFVCIANDGELISLKENKIQKEHASFIHQAIKEICDTSHISLQDLSAISVADGPGSYTGLRVAMSSGKGLSFALKIPFICFHNLQSLALETIKVTSDKKGLYIPLIDARRLEVFTATYDSVLKVLNSEKSLIINESSFTEELQENKVYFSGDGANKVRGIIRHKNAHYVEVFSTARSAARISWDLFNKKEFSDLNYSIPFYIKPFFTG